MTGLELLPKAKAARPDVPVIMITAYGDAEYQAKCPGRRSRGAPDKAHRFRCASRRDRQPCRRGWSRGRLSRCVPIRSVHPPNNGHAATASACLKGAIPEAAIQLDAKSWQRWSRHRIQANPWSPEEDSLETHLVLSKVARSWMRKLHNKCPPTKLFEKPVLVCPAQTVNFRKPLI
jgi:hypothetical protein